MASETVVVDPESLPFGEQAQCLDRTPGWPKSESETDPGRGGRATPV